VGGLIEGYLLSVTTSQGGAGTVPDPAVALSNGHVGPVPIIPVVWVVLAIAVAIVMRRTPLGRRVYATGANPVAARLAGVHVARVRVATYVISGGASALSGVLFAGYVRSVFLDMGQDYLFGGIAAVALGGVALLGGSGSYWGTFAGALTLAFLSAFLPMLGLDDASVKVGYGIVILIGIYLARLLEQASTRDSGKTKTTGLRLAAPGELRSEMEVPDE
jgi:ribose transport system permease protein